VLFPFVRRSFLLSLISGASLSSFRSCSTATPLSLPSRPLPTSPPSKHCLADHQSRRSAGAFSYKRAALFSPVLIACGPAPQSPSVTSVILPSLLLPTASRPQRVQPYSIPPHHQQPRRNALFTLPPPMVLRASSAYLFTAVPKRMSSSVVGYLSSWHAHQRGSLLSSCYVWSWLMSAAQMFEQGRIDAGVVAGAHVRLDAITSMGLWYVLLVASQLMLRLVGTNLRRRFSSTHVL